MAAEAIDPASDVACVLGATGLAPGSLDCVSRPVAEDAFLTMVQQQQSRIAIAA
jgi:hypothetical protein